MANNYEELVKVLRGCVLSKPCESCPYYDPAGPTEKCATLNLAAADAIEELQAAVEREKAFADCWEEMAQECKARFEKLLHAAKKMHTWIFLNTGDEQKAYDECGLSDEMNAALGYGGQFEIKVNDDV